MENPAYTAIENTWKVAVGSVVMVIQLYFGAVLIVSPTYEWVYQRLWLGEEWRLAVAETCKATPQCVGVSIDQGAMMAPVPNRPWQWPGGVITVVNVHAKGQTERVVAALQAALPNLGSHVVYQTAGGKDSK